MKAETSMVQPVGSLVAAGWLSRQAHWRGPPAITETAGSDTGPAARCGVAVAKRGMDSAAFAAPTSGVATPAGWQL
jgi:hypothetical protein